jgi:uncharacterized protein (DUF2141 family)
MQLRAILPLLGQAVRHRPGALGAIGLIAAVPLLAAAAPGGTEVRVTVTGLRSDKGLVQACLTPEPRAFPDCSGNSNSHSLTVSAAGEVVLDFERVAPGRYAIALLHDENGNGRADKTLGMIPKEGFGFSRDAPVRMGPPRFADAAFEVNTAPVRQTVRMRYLL